MSENQSNTFTAKRLKQLAMRVGLFICLTAVGYYVLAVFVAPAFNRSPTVVDAIQKDQLIDEEVRIYVLDYNAAQFHPFSKREYAKLARSQIIDSDAVRQIVVWLGRDFERGRKHHNHPWSIHDGLLRIEVSPKEWYYAYYDVMSMRKVNHTYVVLSALPRCFTNPNGGRIYESNSFPMLLARHDPWWRTNNPFRRNTE